MRIAVLSNVNMNVLIRFLTKADNSIEVLEPEGYANELGMMYNKDSTYNMFSPQITFVIIDLMELICSKLEIDTAAKSIKSWFLQFEAAMDSKQIYYVSDAYLCGYGLGTCAVPGIRTKLENIWLESLIELMEKHGNVRLFDYAEIIRSNGEKDSFSVKMWYMGKILLTNDVQKKLSDQIIHKVNVERRTPRKILFLDLDNTLWGGIAGENDISPIELSDEHRGLAYKNLQRVIFEMQKQGVLLGIISKNNLDDVMPIINNHPHMVLGDKCFVIKKINWDTKDTNIRNACQELNIGTDSAVFFDDNPVERELVKTMLPEVIVPDFPLKVEELPEVMIQIYHEYFEKSHVTKEDFDKTLQYSLNQKRDELLKKSENFDEYLISLEMKLKRENPEVNMERLLQLVNKTNQFNLTTKRYTFDELCEIVSSMSKRIFLYSLSDKFGDNGIVSAVIVDLKNDLPYVEEFVMSCRVMGRNVEYAIMDDVENTLANNGIKGLRGIYIPTLKNEPVAGLYEKLGYIKYDGNSNGDSNQYKINFDEKPRRVYHVTILN
jgi:FkbH-like protein